LQVSTKLSVRAPSDTHTPVWTWWVRPERARSIRRASSASLGLPNTSPSSSTTVSLPTTTQSGWLAATARHLPRASAPARAAGVGARTARSSNSLAHTANSRVYKRSSSWRRGLPDARISFICRASPSLAGGAEAPFAPGGIAQGTHRDKGRRAHRRDAQLCHPLAGLDGVGLRAQVDHGHPELAPVIAVDDAHPVGHAQAVLDGQAATGVDQGHRARVGQLDG